MDSEVQSFSIGKTYARKTWGNRFLNPQDEDTFTKTGISNRWRQHKNTDYGRDGMVVVAIITDDVAWKLGYQDAEECALDIEQELQERYFYRDNRSIHDEYHRGPLVNEPAEGYPIYITFAFSESRPSSREPTTSQFMAPSRPQQDTRRPLAFTHEPIRSQDSFFDQWYTPTASYIPQQSRYNLYQYRARPQTTQGRLWNQYPQNNRFLPYHHPQARAQTTQGRLWNQYPQDSWFFPYHRPQARPRWNCPSFHYKQRYWS